MADPDGSHSTRRWAALDIVLRYPWADDEASEGFLIAFLDDYAPTAIVDPPAAPGDAARTAAPTPPAWLATPETPASTPPTEDARSRASRVFFVSAEARDRARDGLAASEWHARVDVTPIDVEDEGWAERSQATLSAIQVGRLIVAPPWDLPPPGTVAIDGDATDDADTSPAARPAIVIEIEPSMGFGTGHHQSTRLCLRALQAIDLNGVRVIDLGTGSGVLAIAAARLGAASVLAIDDDQDAVDAADMNVRRNDARGIVQVVRHDLAAADAAAPRDAPTPQAAILAHFSPADVVVANLTGALLMRHADAVLRHAAPEGLLVLSGFTEDERASVLHAFRDHAVVRDDREDGWIGLTLRR